MTDSGDGGEGGGDELPCAPTIVYSLGKQRQTVRSVSPVTYHSQGILMYIVIMGTGINSVVSFKTDLVYYSITLFGFVCCSLFIHSHSMHTPYNSRILSLKNSIKLSMAGLIWHAVVNKIQKIKATITRHQLHLNPDSTAAAGN